MKKYTNSNSKGFTIIELLIATVVFSAILLVLTQVVIRLSGTYYHGVIQNQTLNVAKNITNDIVQQIQFTGGDIINKNNPSPWNKMLISDTLSLKKYESYLCIANNQYVYQLNGINDSSTSNGSLILSYNPQCSGLGPSFVFNSSWDLRNSSTISSSYYVSLVPSHMRLVKFNVNPQFGNLYKVDVKVAYGSDANPLVGGIGFNPSSGNCNPNSPYCATTELVTYVEKTVQ